MRRYNNKGAAEDVFRVAAKVEGLSYHAWCAKYGILDGSGERQIRRREIQPPSGVVEAHRTASKMSYEVKEDGDWGIAPDAWAETLNNLYDMDGRGWGRRDKLGPPQ